MSNDFNFDINSVKEELSKDEEKFGKQGKTNYYKPDRMKNHIVILPQKTGSRFWQVLKYHQLFVKNKLIGKVGCPTIDDLKCPICEMRNKLFKYFNKLQDEGYDVTINQEKTLKTYYTTVEHLINVIDYHDYEGLSKVMKMPTSVKKYVFKLFENITDNEEAKEYIGADARILEIRTNGKKRLEKKYTDIKFLPKNANFLKKGKIDKSLLLASMTDLSKIKIKYDQSSLQDFLDVLNKRAAQYFNFDEVESESMESGDFDEENDELDINDDIESGSFDDEELDNLEFTEEKSEQEIKLEKNIEILTKNYKIYKKKGNTAKVKETLLKIKKFKKLLADEQGL